MPQNRAEETGVTGVDDVTVNAEGRVTSPSVQRRPLPRMVVAQRKLAPLIGVPALALVEKPQT